MPWLSMVCPFVFLYGPGREGAGPTGAMPGAQSFVAIGLLWWALGAQCIVAVALLWWAARRLDGVTEGGT